VGTNISDGFSEFEALKFRGSHLHNFLYSIGKSDIEFRFVLRAWQFVNDK